MHWARPLLTDGGEHSSGVVKCPGKFPLLASLMGLRLQYYRLHHPEVVLRYVIFLDYHFFKVCNHRTHGYSLYKYGWQGLLYSGHNAATMGSRIPTFRKKVLSPKRRNPFTHSRNVISQRRGIVSYTGAKPSELVQLHVKMKQQFPPIFRLDYVVWVQNLVFHVKGAWEHDAEDNAWN